MVNKYLEKISACKTNKYLEKIAQAMCEGPHQEEFTKKTIRHDGKKDIRHFVRMKVRGT